MLIYSMSERFRTLVSSEVTIDGDRNVIGVGPSVAGPGETFDLRDRFGHEFTRVSDIKSGTVVTFKTAGGRYWRPTSSDTIADNGTFAGNCQFKLARSGGKSGNQIRHGDTITIAVPQLLGRPRWIVINDEGALEVGPTSPPADKLARFTYFEINRARLETRDAIVKNDLIAGSGQTVVLPVPAGETSATVAFDVALSHEGLPPAGTKVNLDLAPGPPEFNLREDGSATNLPQTNGRYVVTLAPGQARKTLQIVGPAHRPDPCQAFADPFNLPSMTSLRVAADALTAFPGHSDDASVTTFFPVAARSGLQFLIDRAPLFSLISIRRDEVELYGGQFTVSSSPNKLVLNVSNNKNSLIPRGQRFDIAIRRFIMASRPDFPPDPSAILPTTLPEDPSQFISAPANGPFRFISQNRSGLFSFDFGMHGLFTRKPVILCVDVDITQVDGMIKVARDILAIQILP